ncbi:MAG: AI-2E family transporter [Actinomycetota bacterium]
MGEPADRDTLPAWVPEALRLGGRRLFVVLVASALAVLLLLYLFDRLSNVFTILVTSLFLSFALEPAVGWLASRGWRRGAATGLMFLAVLASFVLIVALVVPAVVSGVNQLVNNAPTIVKRAADWLALVGIKIDVTQVTDNLKANADQFGKYALNVAGGALSFAGTILGGIFQWATIGLFTFYLVAEGPKVRRAICSSLPPANQERVLFVWEQAISQTGGYFYSRLLLAWVNGTGMYIVLRVSNVPFAAPLAIFEGVVAAFIPIVGTYIGGAAPTIVGFLTSTQAGIASLAYIVIYQQIENYFLSPRLTAKTMSLHPAVAFGAALSGGALGGLLMAFLALPVAGVIQAAVKEWGKRYAVVETGLTRDAAPATNRANGGARTREGMNEPGEP